MSSPKVDFARIWPLQAAAATLLLGGALHFTLTPAYAQQAGFSPSEIGMIGSAYYVGFVGGSLINPLVFRALGHRRLFLLYALLVAAAVASQKLMPAVIAWCVLRAIVGYLAAGLFAALESWLHAIATNDNRARTLSAYSITNQVALASGQFLFTLTPVASGLGFFISGAILMATTLPLSMMRGPAPAAPASARVRIAKLAKGSPVAFAGFLANGFATAPFWVLGPAFARDSGFDQNAIALFMALPIIGSLLSQWPIARASDRMDRRFVILPVALLAGLAAFAVALLSMSGSSLGMLIAVAAFGANAFVVGMLNSAHMNDRVPREDLTEAAGASFVVYGVSSMIGPLTASWAMQHIGPAGLFWHAGVIFMAFAAFTLTRLLVRAPARTP